ncbi:SET and MYND domain-containing protein 5 isoform X2 [Carcharodon carcharias]|uniref:SET and MYND domain-containing protein 5 isoform X2 n=1 Tax=Carcharodon carcharias TaxID=13397 RepID=UPI001B7E20CF|nr:SET and MYND domain-containing protein 5 isoform X2 [Carcharodon carcharias]
MAAPMCELFSLCLDSAAAGSRVEVRFISNVKGKGLFASKDIRKGETIFVEQPIVSAQFLWNALYKYKACDYCMRSLETAEENSCRLSGNPNLILPHPEQCSVRKELLDTCPACQELYCSVECRQAALKQYHQALCLGPSKDDPQHPLNKLQEGWRNMHYPPETASIMLMARMVAMVKQGQLETLRQLFTKALYEDSLNRWFTPEGFRSLFALVGTNGQGIGTSSLSQWVHGCDALQLPAQAREELDGFIDQLYKDIEKESGEFLNCEGSGLYILQSCCNHSCDPNAETSFPENNFLLHLTALRDIKAGEEVCITYLDCCQRERSRHTRHRILRENYLFICSCPKCVAQAGDPDLTSEEEDEIEADAESAELEDEMTDV